MSSTANPWTPDAIRAEGNRHRSVLSQQFAHSEVASRANVDDEWIAARDDMVSIAAAFLRARPSEIGVEDNGSNGMNQRGVFVLLWAQGADATERAILDGQHWRAAALLKQDLELLAAMGEARAGKRVSGRTPNMKYAPVGFGEAYGRIQGVAHPSNDEQLLALSLLERRDDGVKVLNTVPHPDAQTTRNLYRLHLAMATAMAAQLLLLFVDRHGENDPFVVSGLTLHERARGLLERIGAYGPLESSSE